MKIPLFDIDGTLLKYGRVGAHHNAFSYAFQTVYNITASTNEINSVGKIDNQIIIEVLKLHGLQENYIKEKLQSATKTMAEFFFQNKDEDIFFVLPGVKHLLQILKQNSIPIGLLTGNVEAIGWEKMKAAGLKEFFDFGSFGNLAFKRVDLIKIAQERAKKLTHLSIPDHDFVIIGDSPLDIECARLGHIEVIAVATGMHSAEELQKEKPDLLVDSLEEQNKILAFLEVNKNK